MGLQTVADISSVSNHSVFYNAATYTDGEIRLATLTFVISGLSGGGAERVCCNLANRFSEHGHQCHVVTLAEVTPDDYELNEAVLRTGLGVRRASGSALQSIFGLYRRIKSLRRVIAADDSDTVVSFMDRTNVLVLVATLGLRSRVVVSERNYPPALPPGRFWSALRFLLYRVADSVVVQTEQGADWIRQHTLAQHVVSIPNWIEWPLPRREPIVSLPQGLDGQTVILAVGRDAPQKGFERLLHCYSRVSVNYPEARLVIIGPGEQSALKPLSQKLGIEETVLFPGVMGNVGDWYSRADVFVLSSHFEGFPNVLLEAMAAGCACVAFDIDTGPADIIEHGVNGLLVADDDEADMIRQLEQLLKQKTLRQSLSAHATTVTSQFSVERVFSLWVREVLKD